MRIVKSLECLQFVGWKNPLENSFFEWILPGKMSQKNTSVLESRIALFYRWNMMCWKDSKKATQNVLSRLFTVDRHLIFLLWMKWKTECKKKNCKRKTELSQSVSKGVLWKVKSPMNLQWHSLHFIISRKHYSVFAKKNEIGIW
jgi:hypothetical protein